MLTSPMTLGLLGLGAGLVLTLTVLLMGQRRRYRTLIDAHHVAPEAAAVVRVDHAGWHPDRRSDLENKLATLTEEHARLKENHTVLLARHKALIREFQRMQTEAPARPRRVTPRKIGAQA